MPKRKTILSLVCGINFLVLSGLASAQSIWIDRSMDKAIYLEIHKPDFPTKPRLAEFFNPEPKYTFATSVLFLSTRWRVSGLLLFRAEIPFANQGFKDQSIILPTYNYGADTVTLKGSSDNKFGNPLLGLQLGGRNSSFSGEWSVRFPLMQSEELQKVGSNWAAPFGARTDYDRFEAFLEDTWTLTAAANYQYDWPSGVLLRLRVGLAFLVPTKDYLENDLLVDYSPQVGYQFHRIGLQAGLSGRYLVSENSLDFGERTVHQLGFAANCSAGHLIPGVHFRVPLDDDLQRDLDFVFGINVGYRLP